MQMFRKAIAAIALAGLTVPAVAIAAAPIDDVGCSARLIWFINEGRTKAKDPGTPEAKRAETWGFVESLRGALGYFVARIDATGQADRNAAFVKAFGEITELGKSNHDQLVDQTMECFGRFETAEKRVIDSFKSKK
jgi:hypothetical protein